VEAHPAIRSVLQSSGGNPWRAIVHLLNPASKIKQFGLAFTPTGDSNDRFHFNASQSAMKSATSLP